MDSSIQFKALVVDEFKGNYVRFIRTRTLADLPKGNLLVRVHYSSLNYKDALSATGNKGITKKYPHTPGIDAVGIVEDSSVPEFNIGDEVIVTSYDLGMNTPGGFGQYIRVPAAWAVKLPDGLSMKESMIIGTAGFTAAVCISRLTELVKPSAGRIVVSGATGGVGSMSVALLSQLGYSVVALSGKVHENDFLTQLGAKEVISRIEFQERDLRPMLSAQFAGGVDTVGGSILENIIKSTQGLGAVTCCGNVSSPELDITVFPFILRGISLIGVSTQNYPMDKRRIIWEKLASEWKPLKLLDLYSEISLDQLNESIDAILLGKIKGRTVVNML